MKAALELQPCCGNRSGIGTYVYELAKRLRSEETLSFCGNLFNFCGRNDHSSMLQGLAIEIRENRLLPYSIYRRMWHWLPVSYQNLFPTADLHIFFNYIVPPRVGGKILTTICDCTHLRFPETMDKRNRARIQNGLADSIHRSSHFLTISEFSKREMIDLLGIPEQRISVVYSAPSATKTCTDFSTLAQRLHVTKPYLLYVGTIEPRKNLVRLLKAFERLGSEIPHQLVLAGGAGWNNAEIYQTAAAIRYADRVIFTGYLSEAERNTLYQNASLFVFPSLYEGFGMPPLEAMRFGCPVVCSDAASLPEVVGDAAQQVHPLDESSLADGICRVLSDAAYAAELVQKGYRQAQKFTWEASADQFTQICRRILEEG